MSKGIILSYGMGEMNSTLWEDVPWQACSYQMSCII
ncbi:hypothetical protein Chro_2286 [Chroococcidiopsis thermalis PCC 7203]|uniref:Uncharacterized protein n=1 Tax=Chroococcidiopsis thermalis (strain PCC 7203) TaxID=251229 RepID=K9TZJ1_CHRTP|nr:hypothetical protein Chro_2286 [Chroococcidiopsis thermalis PCC 7203]